MRTNEIHKINCFVKWYYSNAEHVTFLTIWRKWGKEIVDFAMNLSCFSNYPWFCFYFTQPPITQNIEHLRTLNTSLFPVSVQCRQVPLYLCFKLISSVIPLKQTFVGVPNDVRLLRVWVSIGHINALLVKALSLCLFGIIFKSYLCQNSVSKPINKHTHLHHHI